MSEVVLNLVAELGALATRNTAAMIATRVRTLRSGRKAEERVAELEQIINELIADKNEAIRIAQAYEDELMSQRVSDDEIRFITETVVPLAENAVIDSIDQDEDDAESKVERAEERIDMIKSLLSPELLSVLQLIGFNYRAALGEPLTRLTATAIDGLVSTSGPAAEELEIARLNHETRMFEMMLDAEAYGRWVHVTGRG